MQIITNKMKKYVPRDSLLWDTCRLGVGQSNFLGEVVGATDRKESLVVVGKWRLGVWVLKGNRWSERGCGGARQEKTEETPCIISSYNNRQGERARQGEGELGLFHIFLTIQSIRFVRRTNVGTCLASFVAHPWSRWRVVSDLSLGFLFLIIIGGRNIDNNYK